jgi:hypothetical protein
MRLKVGELAKRSGMTVRMLHHYDAINLLKRFTRSWVCSARISVFRYCVPASCNPT